MRAGCLLTAWATVALAWTQEEEMRMEGKQVEIMDQLAGNVQDPNLVRPLTEMYGNRRAPSIQAFHPSFLDILGDSPSLEVVAKDSSGTFAHEAPVWIPATDEIFWVTNANKDTGPTIGNNIMKLSLRSYLTDGNANVTIVHEGQENFNNTNGGTNYGDDILFVMQGKMNAAGGLVRMSSLPPYDTTLMLNNFYGRQFNSPNDVEIHPVTKAIFFTDSIYGFGQGFRPEFALPLQVYKFEPSTGSVEVVADGFTAPNGICFSPDGTVAYVTDTGQITGSKSIHKLPATIYAFDVLDANLGQRFVNRRVFSYVDHGVPDGLKVDTDGNVYVGCSDGAHIFNKAGTLIGKFFVGKTVANLAFAGPGRLVLLAKDEIYLAKLNAEGVLPRRL